MSRSRFGSFFKGWQRFKNHWADMSVPTAPATAPETPLSLDYSKAQGIWDLSSTTQFPKVGGGSGPSVSLGLSDTLLSVSGSNDPWTTQSVDISAYANATVRLVFHGTNNGGFDSDFQIDNINLDGTLYSFENQTHGFETSTNNSGTYAGVSWASVAVESDNRGAWQVDSGGTPSGSTGRSDAADGTYYIYAESSSPADAAGYNFWLRGPELALGASPTLTFSEARLGADIGALTVYLEVTA